MKKRSSLIGLLLATALFAPASAIAHHPNGYMLPDSFYEGLLSGFGHPVIGLDHLSFIIAMGILSYSLKRRTLIPLAFVSSTLIGTVLHLNSVNIIAAELLIGLSVVLIGLALVWGIKIRNSIALIAVFTLSGTLHGYAYGESIIGAESTVLGAYLIGFTSIQMAICLSVSVLCEFLGKLKSTAFTNRFSKIIGGGTAITGLFFLLS